MLKSLYSGVSGIQSHQLKMDVIGNNIANVNTIGYKRGDVVFSELLSQTISGASAPDGVRGGINPVQVGIGVKVGSITNQFTQGNLQYTGSNTDIAIEGNGFFILADGNVNYYTRSGSFALDRDGNLIHSSNGMTVQGWMADENGNINANTQIKNIQIPIGKVIPAKATSYIKFEQNIDSRTNGSLNYQPSPAIVTTTSGAKAQITVSLTPTGGFNEWNYKINVIGLDGVNVTSITNDTGTIKLNENGIVISSGLDSVITLSSGDSFTINVPDISSANGGKFDVSGASINSPMNGVFKKAEDFYNTIRVYDSLGGSHNINMTFSKIGDNQWRWTASAADSDIMVSGSGIINFDSTNGSFVNSDNGKIIVDYGPGLGVFYIEPDFKNTTQFASNNSLLATNQDGYASGSLQNFTIDQQGYVNGTFSNGIIRKLAQLAIANFSNPSGLLKTGGSFYSESNNSGVPYIGTSGTGGRGRLISGNLETSNVDLSKEFTDLITTQRGYQANARVITASDELLQELINIKR